MLHACLPRRAWRGELYSVVREVRAAAAANQCFATRHASATPDHTTRISVHSIDICVPIAGCVGRGSDGRLYSINHVSPGVEVAGVPQRRPAVPKHKVTPLLRTAINRIGSGSAGTVDDGGAQVVWMLQPVEADELRAAGWLPSGDATTAPTADAAHDATHIVSPRVQCGSDGKVDTMSREVAVQADGSSPTHWTRAACQHFGVCGGCKFQTTRYAMQLAAKEQHVRDCFRAYGWSDASMQEWMSAAGPATIVAPRAAPSSTASYRYRNRIELSVSCAPWQPYSQHKARAAAAAEAAEAVSHTAMCGEQGAGSTHVDPSADAAATSASLHLKRTTALEPTLGLHPLRAPQSGWHGKVFQLADCHLLPTHVNALVNDLQAAFRDTALTGEARTRELLASIMSITIRTGLATPHAQEPSLMLQFRMTSATMFDALQPIVDLLSARAAAHAVTADVEGAAPRYRMGCILAECFNTSLPRTERKLLAAAVGDTSSRPSSPAFLASVAAWFRGAQRMYIGEPKLYTRYSLANAQRAAVVPAQQMEDASLLAAISPRSFCQPTDAGLELIVTLLVEGLAQQRAVSTEPAHLPSNGAVVWDLFCGGGLLGLALTKLRIASHLIGCDNNADAIDDAHANARLNNATAGARIAFQCADLLSTSAVDPARVAADWPAPHLVVVDPPRPGLHADLRALLTTRVQPPVIAYVSCNPETQARDVADLCARLPQPEAGVRTELPVRAAYVPVYSRALDQVPHTAHVENVVILVRSDLVRPRAVE